ERVLIDGEVPTVAALKGKARGYAWLIAQLCDGCVYSQTGEYSAAGMRESREMGERAAGIFMSRWGTATGKEMLLTGADYSGCELEKRAVGVRVEEADQVTAAAESLAQFWAKLPGSTLAAR